MKRSTSILAASLYLMIAGQTAEAHFPWLIVSNEKEALLFFGETPDDRTYKLPPSILGTEVNSVFGNGKTTKLDLTSVESETFVGMKSADSVSESSWLTGKVTYGVYHGSRLDYYSQYVGGKLPDKRDAFRPLAQQLDLHAEVVDTEAGVDVFVLWKGKPLTDCEVRLYCAEGHEEGSAKTDESGKVSFDDKQVEPGLNGIVVGHTTKGQSGRLGEQEYDSISHYLTVTFVDPQDFTEDFEGANASSNAAVKTVAHPEVEPTIDVSSEVYPRIPELVTSFGAAIADDSLYVYGGHKGVAHEYYAEAQGNTLWRLDLKNPKSWESLGTGPGLQGLALVAHGHKLYRIGGFVAKNKRGEDKNLSSQACVACYDPATKRWEDMPPLPEPRSSFDAAVLGDHIYVVGGWNLQDDDETNWLSTAYQLDLSSESPQWQPLPEPPFRRRALSVAAHQGRLYVIGGMQEVGGPSTRVDVYDPEQRTWSRGPDLIGEGMDGFGSSSFAVGEDLFVTTYSGTLQRLAKDGNSWELLGTLERDRFFHRLLPISDNQLLTIGGASMSSGKFEELDVIRVPSRSSKESHSGS